MPKKKRRLKKAGRRGVRKASTPATPVYVHRLPREYETRGPLFWIYTVDGGRYTASSPPTGRTWWDTDIERVARVGKDDYAEACQLIGTGWID